jgi:hypothetical protein
MRCAGYKSRFTISAPRAGVRIRTADRTEISYLRVARTQEKAACGMMISVHEASRQSPSNVQPWPHRPVSQSQATMRATDHSVAPSSLCVSVGPTRHPYPEQAGGLGSWKRHRASARLGACSGDHLSLCDLRYVGALSLTCA